MNIQNELDTLSRNQKAEYLRTNATNIKEGTYFRNFTPDEIQEKSEQLVDSCIQLDVKEEEKAEIVKSLSDEIKAMKKHRTNLTTSIKQRGEDSQGEIFEFADHESGFMLSFNIDGNEINRRRLRPEEKQAQLFIHAKQA